MKLNNFLKLAVSIFMCELAGAIGSFFTAPKIGNWYSALNKPFFNPPSWVFGPVWTTLFLMMGISFYLAWKNNFGIKNQIKFSSAKAWNSLSQKLWNGSWSKANAIIIFFFQLLLNILWSLIFFGMQNPGLAFFEMIMLWFAILYTVLNFYRISKISAVLLLPYLAWVSFAGILNYSIWILNL